MKKKNKRKLRQNLQSIEVYPNVFIESTHYYDLELSSTVYFTTLQIKKDGLCKSSTMRIYEEMVTPEDFAMHFRDLCYGAVKDQVRSKDEN